MANLPVPLTSFIGREQQMAQARALLAGTRLLTLTGPGGSGQTRLSIRLASESAAEFQDGVFFVPLAPVRDGDLVLSSIAQSIGLQDSRERPLIEHLTTYLEHKHSLLVLDNFEQLLSAAPLIGEVLRRTAYLKLVVTSRAGLRIGGEQEYDVPPLTLPHATTGSTSAAIVGESESVRLFVERARAILPDFALTDAKAAAVGQIVTRLDGLPLAIELAAARIKLLPPEAMLPKLDRSLGLLVARTRDLPGRQQTLRSTIAWNYELLSDEAQQLLAICSVFRGGASLDQIEAIADAAGITGVDLLSDHEELVDHSLLRRTGNRFTMLETIREFAAERLAELPDEESIRGRHAEVFLEVAETAQYELTGRGELEWLQRMDLEHNNIRAAMDWFAGRSPAMALRMEVAMRPFWSARGHFTEGRQRLSTLLDGIPDRTMTRARALNAEAWLAADPVRSATCGPAHESGAHRV